MSVKLILEMSLRPELNLKGCCHTQNYFGIDREKFKEEIKILTEALQKIYPDVVEFSNFTGDEPNRARVQAKWDKSFRGVDYITLEGLTDE